MNDAAKGVVLSEEVSAALDDGRAVVALETTIVAHGFPPGEGLEVGRECEARVRAFRIRWIEKFHQPGQAPRLRLKGQSTPQRLIQIGRFAHGTGTPRLRRAGA